MDRRHHLRGPDAGRRRGDRLCHRRARFAKAAIAATAVIFVGPILYFSIVGPGFDLSRGFVMRMAARTLPGLGLNLAFIAAAIPTVCAVLLVHLAARLVDGPIARREQEQG